MSWLARWWDRLPRSVRDLIRRALHTAWQAALVLLLPGLLDAVRLQDVASLAHLPYIAAAITGGVAGLVSLLTALASWKVAPQPFWLDTLIRVGKTIGATLLGALTATGVDVVHLRWGSILSTAVLAGLLALVRVFLSLGVPNAQKAFLGHQHGPSMAGAGVDYSSGAEGIQIDDPVTVTGPAAFRNVAFGGAAPVPKHATPSAGTSTTATSAELMNP